MRAEIVAVGTELLLGEILDTNSQYLAQQLTPLGIDLYYVTHVGDNLGRLTDTLQRGLSRSDLLVMTGGLGPTEDDLTREAVAAALGEKMEVVPELERHLRAWFARRNRPMPERNVKQATVIPSAEAVPNPIGTAPGWWVEQDGIWVRMAAKGESRQAAVRMLDEFEPRVREYVGEYVYGVDEEQLPDIIGAMLREQR